MIKYVKNANTANYTSASIHVLHWCVACLLTLVLGAGCATQQGSFNGPGAIRTLNHASPKETAASELTKARGLLDSGQEMLAIPVLNHILAEYPQSNYTTNAIYFLGLAYYKTGVHRDAIKMFNRYLELSPDNRRAQYARNYLEELDEEYRQRFPTPAELDAQIAKLSTDTVAEPTGQIEVADLLWRRGKYEQAGEIYAELLSGTPDMIEDTTIRSRLEINPDGTYTLLTPAEIVRRQIEAHPAEIINVSGFEAGREQFTGHARYYSVTGQVVNRSESILYGTQVLVTIYGFGNKVYDTQTVNIGQLRPGETRAFVARFSNFESLERIQRQECVATFLQ